MIEMLRRNVFIIFISIGVVVVIFVVMNREEEPTQALLPVSTESSAEEVMVKEERPVQLVVDIKGEVRQPGVYEMNSGARVKDVVKQAGGFTEEADQHSINLAQKVMDEMILIVPKVGEVGSSTTNELGSKIRINHATVEEIQELPGIGPSKAKAIVDYREEVGFFQKAEDLLNVSGIGEKTLESLLEEIQIP